MSTIEPKKQRHRGRWIIVIILCLLIGRFLYAVFYKDIHCGGEQAKMVKYLENKYGKKYVTKNCHINMAGMWMDKFFAADAHEVNDASLTFEVEGNNGRYHDTFITEYYNNQEEALLGDFIKKNGINAAKYYSSMSMKDDLEDELMKLPPINQVLHNYGDKISYDINIVTNGESPNDNDVKNIEKLLEYARSRNYSDYAVRYTINSISRNMNRHCQLEGKYEKLNVSVGKSCFINDYGRE
ncbi:MAG: hypothetical protein ACFNVL_01155 [Candidatus Nanoperiomorbus sp.]